MALAASEGAASERIVILLLFLPPHDNAVLNDHAQSDAPASTRAITHEALAVVDMDELMQKS